MGYYASTYPAHVFNLAGLGATSPTAIVGAVSSSAGAVLAPTIAAALAPTFASIGIASTAAIPIVGAAIALLGFGIEAIINSGCGQPCVVTTQWANQAEAAMQQNITAYFAIPAPRPRSVQAAAVANFDALWNALAAQCNSPALGAPGQRCISDRAGGACVWHQATTPPWGSPVQGACWNWNSGYRAPIANDTNVVDDTAQVAATTAATAGVDVSTVISSASTAFGSYAVPLAIAAGLLTVFAVVK